MLDPRLDCPRLVSRWRLLVPANWAGSPAMIDKREIIDTVTALWLPPSSSISPRTIGVC